MADIQRLQYIMAEAQQKYDEVFEKYNLAKSELETTEHELYNLNTALKNATTYYIEALEKTIEQSVPISASAKEMSDEWADPGPKFQNIVIDAGCRSAKRRLPALRSLEKMGPKAIDPLLTILRRETYRLSKRLRVVQYATLAAGAVGIFQLSSDWMLDRLYAVDIVIFAVLCVLLALTRTTRLQQRAAHAIARIDDARAVGPLAEALDLNQVAITRAATDTLTRLLPRLRASDRPLITDMQLACLYRALPKAHRAFALAILASLEQIGDEHALPVVEKLANKTTYDRDETAIRNAARACLPALIDHVAASSPGKRLLRPSAAPDDQSAILLRPASAGAGTAEELLLRPAARNKE